MRRRLKRVLMRAGEGRRYSEDTDFFMAASRACLERYPPLADNRNEWS
jgi:hypothetical protein